MFFLRFSCLTLAQRKRLFARLALTSVCAWGIPQLFPSLCQPLCQPLYASPLPGQAFPSSSLEDSKPVKDDPSFLAFAAWTQKYRQAAKEKKSSLEAEGVALAQKRRTALSSLIQNNPQHALEWAISFKVRAALPDVVQKQLETPVSGCGDYNVLAAFGGQLKKTAISRYAVLDNKPYKAFVYGRMRGLTSKINIPLHGIAVDNLLALHESPARPLETGETVPAGAKIGNPDKNCPLCGAAPKLGSPTGSPTGSPASAPTGMVAAQIGTSYYFFDSTEHLQRVAQKLIEKQAAIGPKAGSFCDEPLDALIQEIKEDDARHNTGIGFGNNGAPAGDFVPRVAPEPGDLPGAVKPEAVKQ